MCRLLFLTTIASACAFGNFSKQNDCGTRDTANGVRIINAAFADQKKPDGRANNPFQPSTDVLFTVPAELVKTKLQRVIVCVFQGERLLASDSAIVGQTAKLSADGKLVTIDYSKLPNVMRAWPKADDVLAMVRTSSGKRVFLDLKGSFKRASSAAALKVGFHVPPLRTISAKSSFRS